MNQFPYCFDDERIARNRKAHGAPPRNCRGGGDGGNGSRSYSGGGGCGGGGNYGRGNFSSLAKNETVFVVNGKAYTVCKDCGWNSGDLALTSGGHELSRMSGYSVTFSLKTNMNNLLGAAEGGSGGDCMNDSSVVNGGMNSLAVIMMEICFIIGKEDSNPDNAAFAGIFY